MDKVSEELRKIIEDSCIRGIDYGNNEICQIASAALPEAERMEQRIAELEADKARMDWLISARILYTLNTVNGNYSYSEQRVLGKGTVREAIDAARTKEEKRG